MLVAPGATSISVDVFYADDSGAAVTGAVAADFPVCKWSGGSNTADSTITLSDLAAITTAHPNDNTAGGVKAREGGWYRLDLPNNMFTSAGRKTLTFAETTNKRILAPSFDVQYVQGDVQTIKTQSVTCAAGVTVGAFVGNATAALGVDASGRVDVGKFLGTASQGAAGYVGIDWGHVNAPTTTVGLSGTTVGTVTAATLGNTAHGGAASTLTLKSIAVNNSSGYALNLVSSDSAGLHITGGTGSPGVFISGQSDGVDIVTSGTGDGIVITAGVGNGINVTTGTGFAMTGGDIDANLVRKVLGGGAGTITGDGVRAASVTGAVGSIASGGITSASFASGAVDATAFAQGAADKTWSTATRQLTGTQSFNLTGNVTGNLSGSIGSIAGVTFPANFSVLSITAVTGRVDLGKWLGDVPGIVDTGDGTIPVHLVACQDSAIANNAFAPNAIDAGAFAQGAADKVWSTAARTVTGGTITTVTNTVGANVLTWLGTTPLVLVSQKVQAAASIANYLATGTVASTTGTTTTLDTGSVNTASFYANSRLVLTAGTGAGQERVITAYASGRIATHAAWTTNPDATTTYEIRDASSTATATVSAQSVADALLLAPSGVAATGSQMDYAAKTLKVSQANSRQ